MTIARDFFDNLSETLMPTPKFGEDARVCFSGHVHESEDQAVLCELSGPQLCCHICLNPVTDSQLADGDAYVKDSKGSDDGEYEHRECGQAMKGER